MGGMSRYCGAKLSAHRLCNTAAARGFIFSREK